MIQKVVYEGLIVHIDGQFVEVTALANNFSEAEGLFLEFIDTELNHKEWQLLKIENTRRFGLMVDKRTV